MVEVVVDAFPLGKVLFSPSRNAGRLALRWIGMRENGRPTLYYRP